MIYQLKSVHWKIPRTVTVYLKTWCFLFKSYITLAMSDSMLGHLKNISHLGVVLQSYNSSTCKRKTSGSFWDWSLSGLNIELQDGHKYIDRSCLKKGIWKDVCFSRGPRFNSQHPLLWWGLWTDRWNGLDVFGKVCQWQANPAIPELYTGNCMNNTFSTWDSLISKHPWTPSTHAKLADMSWHMHHTCPTNKPLSDIYHKHILPYFTKCIVKVSKMQPDAEGEGVIISLDPR